MGLLSVLECSRSWVCLACSSVVDHGFIGDVMVGVLASSAVDHGFIGDVMVGVLASRRAR